MNTMKNNESKTENVNHAANQKAVKRRNRRHWYDHEKLGIIAAYDQGQLPKAKGSPNCVYDPKSKEELSIFAIEQWKDQFRTMGVLEGRIRPAPVKQSKVVTVPQKVAEPVLEELAMEKLLLKALIRNQELEEQLQANSSTKKSHLAKFATYLQQKEDQVS